MTKKLPVQSNLEHLKAQAKDLLSAFRGQDQFALKRIRDSLPSARGLTYEALARRELKLHDAQSVIAREYGFASWAELRTEINSHTPAATNEAATDRVNRLAKEIRKSASHLSMLLPWRAESTYTLYMSLRDMSDVLVARAPVSLSEKASYAAEADLCIRMERALTFMGIQVK